MPKTIGTADAADPMEREWKSGFYKDSVDGAVQASPTGLAGDGQADLKNHGGRDKAINSYPQEHFPYWKKQLNIDCAPGAFGENFTTSGLLEENVFIGDTFQVGGATVQISQPRQPCWKLSRRWRVKNLAALVQETGRTGWYFRVLIPGEVKGGDSFRLLERLHPEWSVCEANRIMHHLKKDWDAAYRLGSCRALSESWKNLLLTRAAKYGNASQAPRLDRWETG